MDAEQFDTMAKAMASGSTRRLALRLAGGAMAGALLAAAGLGRRAGAQGKPTFSHCNAGGGGILWDQGEDEVEGLPCGGNEDCPQGRFCTSVLLPGNRLACRCVSL